MTLSTRAEKYVEGLRRLDKWTCDRKTIVEYFDYHGFPLFEPLIDFQVNFSGLKLKIDGHRNRSFLLRLFSRNAIDKKERFRYWQKVDDYWVDCGEHETAQYNFYINQNGEICVDSDDTPNIICSSVEKMIEQYAWENKLSSLYENPFYYNLGDTVKLKTLLQREKFYVINECSDKYSTWVTNGDITIIRGTWLESPEFYLHFYAHSEEKCERIISRMKTEKIII